MARQKTNPSRIEAFEQLCRRQGMPLTVQRRLILEALLRREDHPTVDRIFEDVRRKVPGVSRTTVYRVLETLVKVGVARKVSHPQATARFETKTERHHHLVCFRCEKVVDLEDSSLNRVPLPDARLYGFDIEDYSIYFRGICSGCARKSSPVAARRARTAGGSKQKTHQERRTT
jgi:Fur family peroxide stress response transcriptional regulator